VDNQNEPTERITFLGTGGGRIVVANQLLASGGLWLELNGTEILVDPGPGSIVQSTKRKLRAERLSAIILSHRHLDHSGDVNIMVEAMTNGGFKPHGWLYAPSDALGSEPVIYSYLRNYLDGIGILTVGGTYSADNVTFSTPVRHIHQVETYGMVFTTGKHTFSYISDSRYFDGLCQNYGGELLIINVVFTETNPCFDHLAIPDASKIITCLKPRVSILSHFGSRLYQARPWQLAEELSQKTGMRVIAARDGMRFDLAELDRA
jgi:ribonuclease BN (tRNA processing enzyme)